ncbi:hypothetical protein [Halogeometricum borinquense]|uniref:hypothetical protein n=1 Tax=Halogeometricum borinquense TaxID=60847 RepID=UPI001EF93C48|nr:hypothetical protein [Halogeometricum borinquense]
MSSRRRVLKVIAASGIFFSGCSGPAVTQPELRRDLGFRRKRKFHVNQTDIDANRPLVNGYLIDNEDDASNLNWDMLLDRTAKPYQQTNYSSDFLILLVGLVDAGNQVSTNQWDFELDDQAMTFRLEITGESNEPDEPIYSYRLQRWSDGTLTNTNSVETTLV